MHIRPVWIATLALLGTLTLTSHGQPTEEVALVALNAEGVSLSFTPSHRPEGPLNITLHDLDGKVLAERTIPDVAVTVTAQLSADIDPEKPADYYVSYSYGEAEPTRKSLFFLSPALETIVLAQREYLGGSRPVVQVLVRNRSTERPVANAKVTVSVTEDDKTVVTGSVTTDHRGAASVALDLPDRDIPSAQLQVEAASATARDTVTESIRVHRGTRTLLTTDKPLYQPGQTIHLRALSLSRPSMKPLAAAEVVFEIQDAKGNKVFKKKVTTDAYGVSHADFVLAHELNQGAYKIRHIAGPVTEEKTVTVQPYVLPKFKVAFKSDRAFYQPGETVRAEVQTDYFFGKPVAGAEVHVSCAKFDAVYTTFQELEGKTDENGHYAFEVKLPGHFVGQPFEQGKGSAKLEITVIDTADHREQVTHNVSVTENPIIMAAIPESGTLVPGLENRVYIVTTYADAKPASCRVTWRNGRDGAPATVQTDDAGFGEVTLTPEAGEQVALHLDGADAAGLQGHAVRTLETRAMTTDDRVLLRTDRALYKVGDSVNLEVRSSRRSGTAYLDVIKDGQTQSTRTLDLVDGQGSLRMTLDPALAGTVQFSAYVIGGNGVVVRDRRVVLVDPANDLAIEVLPGQDTYLPGEDARIEVRVTNPAGDGVASALGVTIVDEAVFALQDMQPGMEKVYFYLEREIAKPRYEIHGVEIDGVMPCLDVPAPLMRREQAAKALLASAAGTGDYPIQVNTYERDQKGSAFETRMQEVLARHYERINRALIKYCRKHSDDLKEKDTEPVTLDDLVRGGFLRKNQARDPWGQAMRISGPRCTSCVAYHDLVLSSAGIDGKWDTADDVTYSQQVTWKRMRMDNAEGFIRRGMGLNGGMEMEFMLADAPMAMAASAVRPAAGAQAEPPRVRQYFPETLYFNPAVITDGDGVARLTIPMADSITTWRMSCMASSSGGALGSTDAGLRVFQDFFVDVDFPVALTQHDEVSVPVVVYNYLKTDQEVKLVAEKADWFDLKGAAEQTVALGPSEVKAVYFPIEAKGIGNQKFTVFAYGSDKSDAIARSVEVQPDGKEYLVSFSGQLEGTVTHTVAIPNDAIAKASKVFVKVYPGVLSQVVEGLDGILRMPFGCFEQTSSATYPNILVMDYMKTTGQISPELQMKAEGFINAGYQRLVSFEVEGGGFEWFGKAPAHRILTAYGLMEFHDMSKVHEVDPSIIARTQRWLASGQEQNGSFKPSEGGIAEGAVNAYRDNVLRSTAYIAWALAYSGHQGPEVEKALRFVRMNTKELKDNFTLALAANALATVAPRDEATIQVLNMLMERRTEEDDAVHWKAETETPTHGRGEPAHIEVTGLAVQAFITAGRELGTVSKAVTWLVRNKDAYGTWQSTQATIQALRAMLMAERGATSSGKSSIDVEINGETVTTLTVDETNSDILQLVDMKDLTRSGDNPVVLAVKGEGGLLYQVVGRYYLPHREGRPEAAEEPGSMSIEVAYDRTELTTDDLLGVTATVEYQRAGRAKMVLVDLGLPPGFTLVPDRLEEAVAAGTIEKYTATGRQLIIYLDALESGEPVSIAYQLRAKYPLRAKTGKAAVYEYYDPASRAEAAPVELSVTGP